MSWLRLMRDQSDSMEDCLSEGSLQAEMSCHGANEDKESAPVESLACCLDRRDQSGRDHLKLGQRDLETERGRNGDVSRVRRKVSGLNCNEKNLELGRLTVPR